MLISSSRAMGAPFFHELKKQASFFFKEKIKNARLALTDVTPIELLTEEATNGSPGAPDAMTMSFISRAAFEIDDYWRIVHILHSRLLKFDRQHWREPYQALVLLEHMITHGPGSTADEFQCDVEVIQEMENFQYIDERGFNWGSTVRKKSERVLKLLKKGEFLKEERGRARKVTREIKGFGSFSQRVEQASDHHYRKWNSHYEPEDDEEQGNEADESVNEKLEKESLLVESLEDGEGANVNEVKNQGEEVKPLVSQREERRKAEIREGKHPFSRIEHQSMESTLLLSQS